MMNMKFAIGGLALTTLLIGTSGTADARGSPFQIAIDKDGAQFGPSLDPRRHGYEQAFRDGADRGRFDLEHGFRYNLNAWVYSDTARGYQLFMGNKGQYRQGYREGYKAGYDSAYRGGTQQYGQLYGRTEENQTQYRTGFQRGYHDGYGRSH
jgi:hypothetical protein